MASDFSIQTRLLDGKIAVIDVSGYLDAHTFEEMDKAITGVFDRKIYKVVVLLEKVPYISSAGAGVFIGTIGTAQDNNGNIVLVKPTPNVREVFDLLGLTQIFTFAESVEAAAKTFK